MGSKQRSARTDTAGEIVIGRGCIPGNLQLKQADTVNE
jgi:hypothetical protein